MKNIQEVFDRIQEVRREQRELRGSYKDALENSTQYREIIEEYKKIREKKLRVEHDIQRASAAEFARLETIKNSLKTDNEMLSDIALTHLMKGESVGITDEHNNQYEPVFAVKFKKKA
ncbi:MAG: hypothetical protein AAB783_00700 [Patescibacteria group bacterium]